MLKKFSNWFWGNSEPQYTLNKSVLIPFAIYRVYTFFLMLYCIWITTWIFYSRKIQVQKVFIYLTNWGIFLSTLCFLCLNLNILILKGNYTFFWKFTNLLFEAIVVIEILITIFFWSFLYNKNDFKENDD